MWKTVSLRSPLLLGLSAGLAAFIFTGNIHAGEAAQTSAMIEERSVLVVVGLPGEEEFATQFNAWAANWHTAADLAKVKRTAIGLPATAAPETDSEKQPTPTPAGSDKDRLQKFLEAEPKTGVGGLWIVMIGHGTFNGKEAKFNLRGPDVTASELGDWLKPFQRPVAVIDCASASAPFINALSASNRVIVAATRSGYEQNFTRFGKYISEAVADIRADLDKDGQVSLLEAFITASKQAAEFYKSEGRLATEHALLDDNGDGHGTPADWFRGVSARKKSDQAASVDGAKAHQWHLVRSREEQKLNPETRAKRDGLELSILKLRDQKSGMPEEEYYLRLEALLLELGSVYGLRANAVGSPERPTPK
jgi:hypothetical protein